MFCNLSIKDIFNCLYWCILKMNYWATFTTGGTMYFKIYIDTHTYLVSCYIQKYVCTMGGYSHVHTSVAGSGFHIPSAPHIAVILLLGTNPELHLKNISAPSVVFWYDSMKPLPGTVGSLQLTDEEEREYIMQLFLRITVHLIRSSLSPAIQSWQYSPH